MMSSKGAIKKTAESKNPVHKSVRRVKAQGSSLGVNDADDKPERREKRKEPQIIDSRAAGDRKTKAGTTTRSKSILPDKNPVKVKQLKQNGLSTPKSSYDDSTQSSSSSRKLGPSRTKSESTVKATDKSKSTVRKSTKDKVQALYNEKRGTSSLYIPKDSTSGLSSTSKVADSKRSKDKSSVSKSTVKPLVSKTLEKSPVTKSSEQKSVTAKTSQKTLKPSNNEKSKDSKNSEKPLPKRVSRERRRSRTLSPSEVKMLRSSSKDKSKSSTNDNTAKNESEDDYEYEEDFEDYESDFEDYTVRSQISEASDNSAISIDLEPIILQSEEKKRTINSAEVRKVDEEHMLDSGHYELEEAKKRAAMVESLMTHRIKTPPPLPELKEPVNNSYREEKQSENKSLPSSTDEGFEDSRSGDFVKSPPVSQITLINQDKRQSKKAVEVPPKKKVLTRGQVLMNMIKLDTVDWSLYETKPISYDEFIRSYGKLNTQQSSTQTKEDNLDVEIQTDICEIENKWTQFPVSCRSKLETNEDVRLFKMEHMGVGGDKPDNKPLITPTYDVVRLNEFLSRAGKVVLALLEEKESGGNILQNETHEFPFSEGFIKLSISSISFLCGRQVTMLHYSEINSKILMSIHASANEKIELLSKEDYIMDCCIGCVWNVNEPSRPIKLFYSQNPITACCFHCTNSNIVFAGLQDGSICLWDLREEESWHQKIVDKINEMDWVIRSPTYTTAGSWEAESHLSPIVAIRILSRMEQDDAETFSDKFVPIQICTLDEEGRLIIWSVLRNLSANNEDLGLTQWGKVKLVKSQEVPLFIRKSEKNNAKKEFVDMNVDNVDSNNLYLATNDTNILYSNCIGAKSKTPYKISGLDSCGSTTCIEVCPYKQPYFFAGCGDGSIRLHYSNAESPLVVLKNEDSFAGIRSIQWSRSKPMSIYVLDDYSRIFVWDLNNSDIRPTHSVSTKSCGYVKCMRLSPCNTNRDMLNQYIALGTDTGNVEVHKLKKNFYFSQQDDLLQEMNKFLQYASTL